MRIKEWDIYGSKRVGIIDTSLIVYAPPTALSYTITSAPPDTLITYDTTSIPDSTYAFVDSSSVTDTLVSSRVTFATASSIILPLGFDSSTTQYYEGQKRYELTNHLGNVLVTVSDKKNAVDTTTILNIAQYYMPEIINSEDFYPFGFEEPGRTYRILRDSLYRFNFNGKEKTDEMYGTAIGYDYGARFEDVRLGRFLSVDPITKKYPELSSYQFASNTPIWAIDLDGNEKEVYFVNIVNDQKTTHTQLTLDKAGPLGNGVAVALLKNNHYTFFYGKDVGDATSFTQGYEGNGKAGHPFESYIDDLGNLTVGYGHLVTEDEANLYPEHTKITSDEANSLFSNDWTNKSDLVDKYAKVIFSDMQKDAMTDFAFNIKKPENRVGQFSDGDNGDFYYNFMLNSDELPGLAARRLGEAYLFDYSKYIHFDLLNTSNSQSLNKLISPYLPPTYPMNGGCIGPEPAPNDNSDPNCYVYHVNNQ